MTSFLQRSAQKSQLSPSKRGVEDVFSEFRHFRNETKRKAENSHSKLLMESPQQTNSRFQPYGSSSFISTKNSTSQVLQIGGGYVQGNTRHASNISPQKKSTVGIQQQSPQKSYLYRENLHEQCQQHAQQHLPFSRSPVNQINSGLDNLQREIKEISFSKHFNHQITAARQESKKKLANLSPSKKNQLSPARASAAKLFGSYQSSQGFDSQFINQQQQSQYQQQVPSGLSSLYSSSQIPTQTPFQRRNSQQPKTGFNSSFNQNQKIISYSPTRYSQRLFSPNRLLNRLGSPIDSQFQDFEYPATQNSPRIKVKTSNAIGAGNQGLGSASAFGFKRSNSVSGNSLTQLLNETKSRIKNNGLQINLSPSTSFANKRTSNTNNINLNNSSYLSPNNKNSDIFNVSQTAYIVDKRAHDLEDYIKTLSNNDFSSLPRENVESLIKLSSIIMNKVKGSTYYRGSLF